VNVRSVVSRMLVLTTIVDSCESSCCTERESIKNSRLSTGKKAILLTICMHVHRHLAI